MKNYFYILLFFFTIESSFAQVVNGDFEIIKPNSLPSNWGMNFFQQAIFDPATGQSVSPIIQYTSNVPYMVYGTSQAQTGSYAMEISNAFNVSLNKVIPGSATLFEDSEQDIPGWSFGVPVNPNANLEQFGFYYKFLPIGNDLPIAILTVDDENGNEIGRAEIQITVPTSNFQFISTPIVYTSNVEAARMNITFSMGLEEEAKFGSRLIIDNVITNMLALSTLNSSSNNDSFVYPTITSNEINIVQATNSSELVNIQILNIEGKIIKEINIFSNHNQALNIDVSNFQNGVYIIKIETKNEVTLRKFVKK